MRNPVCDAKNTHFGQRYATLGAIIDTVRAPLAKHGLAVIQSVSAGDGKVRLKTAIIHTSGEFVSSEVEAAAGTNIQHIGSAITYLRRYALCAMLSIVGDVDDDGEAAVAPTRQPEEPALEPGWVRAHIIEVQPSETKTGKRMVRVLLDVAGKRVTAGTFDLTVGEVALGRLNHTTEVRIETRHKDGKVFYNLAEVK